MSFIGKARDFVQHIIHPYGHNDPIPVPEVLSQDSEADWAMWQATVQDDGFPKTEHMELTLEPLDKRK